MPAPRPVERSGRHPSRRPPLKLPKPWREELTILAVLGFIVAVILAVCWLFGDKLTVGPHP